MLSIMYFSGAESNKDNLNQRKLRIALLMTFMLNTMFSFSNFFLFGEKAFNSSKFKSLHRRVFEATVKTKTSNR